MIYTIKKGSHYSNNLSMGGLHSGIRKESFKVLFSPECLIAPTQSDCTGDWNKLYGFSYGYHHSNSLRLVWKAFENRIRIGYYIYENGKVTMKGFITVDVLTQYDSSIEYDNVTKSVKFMFSGKTVFATYGATPSVGYYLRPYFGGNCPAPATMTITLI